MQIVGYETGASGDEPPALLVSDGETISRETLERGNELEYTLGERHCAGTFDGTTHVPCPRPDAPYCDVHTSTWVCARCTGTCLKAEMDCFEDHAIYLAAFAPTTFKVGVTRDWRLRTRLREQGADRAAHLVTVKDGRIAREREAEIADTFTDRVRVPAKIRTLNRTVDDAAWQEALSGFDPLETFEFDYGFELESAPVQRNPRQRHRPRNAGPRPRPRTYRDGVRDGHAEPRRLRTRSRRDRPKPASQPRHLLGFSLPTFDVADVTLSFENGTLRVEAEREIPYTESDPRSKTRRAPAFRYAAIRNYCTEHGLSLADTVLDLPELPPLYSAYELRDYQEDALDSWDGAGRRGVLELPTGSGKTVIGIKALERCQTATLVVVPTIDLLTQWRRILETEFDVPIGQLGGGEQNVEGLTVSTYDSAYLRADDIGDRFGLVIFDEVHHLGGEGYREIARLLAAPARMGLTATFERPDGAHEVVSDLVGSKVFDIDVDELAGTHLAPYDVKRMTVELTPEERDRYEQAQGVFTDYLASSSIQMRSGSDYQELVKRSGSDPKAREALLAKQRARDIMMNSEAKVTTLAEILDNHRDDRIIVFTAHNDLVYRLSERFLIPAITHQTSAPERREVLDRFRRGDYSRVITSNVLDEGVDVPDANVAVVLSGSGSEREFTQRLGRILRAKDDGGRAILYEVVTEETAEVRVANRRR